MARKEAPLWPPSLLQHHGGDHVYGLDVVCKATQAGNRRPLPLPKCVSHDTHCGFNGPVLQVVFKSDKLLAQKSCIRGAPSMAAAAREEVMNTIRLFGKHIIPRLRDKEKVQGSRVSS